MKARLFAPLLITSFFIYAIQIVGQSTNQISTQDRTKVSALVSRLRARVDSMRRASRLPGIQVGFCYVDGVTADGKPRVVSGSFASGELDSSTGAALTTTDRMPIGSVANTFLAALALQLVEKGQMKFDDKISRWLGSEPWFAELPNGNDITLSMLLNQSSGIENHATNSNFQKQWLKSAGRNIKREELISYVLNKKPLFPAGSDYAYSETNYVLAGMIIEKVTGKPLIDLITEAFIKPYKLDSTTPANGLVLPGVATGYLKGKPVIVDGKFTINPQWEWAGGTFVSTAEDMARWARLIYGGDVLSESARDRMVNSMTTGEGIIYGLGVVIARSKWGRTYGHDGEFPGYLSEIRYYTKHKLAISMLVNSEETPEASRFLISAVDDFAEIIIQANTEPETTVVDRAQLQKLTENWLGLVDAGEFDKAWEQVSDRLKMRLPKSMWDSMIRNSQRENGKLKARKLVSITSARSGRKLVSVQFDTEFSKLPTATESIVLEFEDGEWRITNYSIR
jgi:D-alanyl-D-alanine carboxypeptidase